MRILEEKKLLGASAAAVFFRKTDRTLPEHQLDCYKFVFFSRAAGTLSVKELSYPLKKGTVLILPPFTPHRIRLVGEAEYADLLISSAYMNSREHRLGCELMGLGSDPESELGNLRRPDPLQQKWLSLWLERMALWEAKDTKPFCAEFLSLLLTLRRAPADSAPSHAEPLYEIKEYVDKHFTRPITLEELARRYSYSPFHLSRSFKEREGVGFKEYLLSKRLDYACRLLIDGRWAVHQICQMAGFSNRSFFYRYFHKKLGMTPDAYRQKHASKY